MAAARQKEMKVSITEDATISRTRLEGGATVVREDPIAKVPAKMPAAYHPGGQKTIERPAMSLFANSRGVNRKPAEAEADQGIGLVFADEFLEVFEKADQNHDRGACQADEEQYFQQAHEENGESHTMIIFCRMSRKYKGIKCRVPCSR
jgi:hypothetical protein